VDYELLILRTLVEDMEMGHSDPFKGVLKWAAVNLQFFMECSPPTDTHLT
jgi:hypothetical protein